MTTKSALDYLYLGIDLGSTTAKYVLLNSFGDVLAKNYVRHQSLVVEALTKELLKLDSYFDVPLKVNFTGSAALNIADDLKLPFIQEVIAATTYLKSSVELVDVAIELGGEDGKIIFLSNGIELRMNEACAGGTGAFIDQMATLLNVSTPELNELAREAKQTYPIASRCGVFAKTDLVALLNQGISKADIAKSVFDAVCEQTISGLACGRSIVGNISFLGGPLSFLTELKESFKSKLASDKTNFLELSDTQYAIAFGAARALLNADRQEQNLNAKLKQAPVLDAHHPARSRSNSSSESTARKDVKAVQALNHVHSSQVSDLSSDLPFSALADKCDDSKDFTTISTILSKLAHCKNNLTATNLSPLFIRQPSSSNVSSIESTTSLAASAPSSASLASKTHLESSLDSQACVIVREDEVSYSSPYGLNESYEDFVSRHAQDSVVSKPLSEAHVPLFLGIDLGSTTIKLVLINEANDMFASYYAHNGGEPLKNLMPKVKELIEKLPEGAYIAAICATGYGADLAKAALNAQFTEVETLAHQKAAVAFDPQVTYVIDIGGQDMKCIKVDNGVISSIALNEACSSGCGSFLETFAAQLKLPLKDFVHEALNAQAPCDLGTRCTVFMNSKVKQAQRDNVPIGDIAAGLCLSIVRNALYKVLRIHDSSQLGEHVVVQGGTFLNDAILRAFELNIGRDVVRPNIAGLMGAFGAALIAKERCVSKDVPMVFSDELFDLSKVKVKAFRCNGCNNHCNLTMNTFLSGQKHIHGNRCDFALKNGGAKAKSTGNNFFDTKLDLLFNRPILLSRAQHAERQAKEEAQERAMKEAQEARAAAIAARRAAAASKVENSVISGHINEQTKLNEGAGTVKAQAALKANVARENALKVNAQAVIPAEEGVATRGSIGIPRVLNIFEHYPFWHALFTSLGFNVVLSPLSTKEIAALGNQTIPSQSLCLPAKLAHGHISYLAQCGVDRVFLPCVPREGKYFKENDDSFACPVVGGYPEALKLNLQSTYPELKLFTPYLLLNSDKSIMAAIKEIDASISKKELTKALASAHQALDTYRKELLSKALEKIEYAREHDLPLIVLGGHPYHLDPLINHGIPALIASMDTVIVSEDAIAQLCEHSPELEVVNQWAFHSRLYRAAQYVIEHEHSQMVQLVSFGCGIDAITSEQIKKLLERNHKLYTMLKIDEGDTLGAAKIRLRSLLCATYDEQRNKERLKAMLESGSPAHNIEHMSNLECHSKHDLGVIPSVSSCTCAQDQTCSCNVDEHGLQYDHDGCCHNDGANHSIDPMQSIEGHLEKGSCGRESYAQPSNTSHCEHAMTINEALHHDVLKERTLYMPQMAPVHFPILAHALESLGYKIKLLDTVSNSAIELGLKHVNNDACYPAIVAIGQLIEPVVKGSIDPDKSALLLAQTCGPCRATNYPALLHWALSDLKAEHIPVVTFQGSDLKDEKLHLKLGLKGLKRLMTAILYGDLLQSLYLHCHTYEQVAGTTKKLVEQYQKELNSEVLSSNKHFKRRVQEIIRDFDQIPLKDELRPKVGIVGEILLKYHPQANNNLVEHIIAEGAEPVLGDISAFILYCMHDIVYQAKHLGASKIKATLSYLLLRHFESERAVIIAALKKSKFASLPSFSELMEYGSKFVSLGQQAGEGWLLTAEMVDFIEHDIENVLCVQPFACLPNHITGKGVMRAIRETYPLSNLCTIDYEAGSAQSNVINRIKLFITQAKDNLILKQEQDAAKAQANSALSDALQDEANEDDVSEHTKAHIINSFHVEEETKLDNTVPLPDSDDDIKCS